jgi:hypothetical protein
MRREEVFWIFKFTEIVVRVFIGEKNFIKHRLLWRGRCLGWDLRHFLFLVLVSNGL